MLRFSVTIVVSIALVPTVILPQMANGPEPDIPSWLTSATIQSQIAIVFDRIDNIDIVLDDHAIDRMDQLDYLVRHLRGKSIRIYQETPTSNGVDRGGCTASVPDRDYDDEYQLIRWDRTFGSFAKIWEQNEHDGYVVFGNLNVFERLVECLVGPTGTYLVLPDGKHEDQVEQDQVSRLMHDIWNRNGACRVFTLMEERIYWYNPFATEGDGYGALKELSEAVEFPEIPRNDFKGYPLRIEMFWSTYTVPMNESVPEVDFLGPDAEVCRALTTALNFTRELHLGGT